MVSFNHTLGLGCSGRVYLGFDRKVGRHVAVKVVNLEVVADAALERTVRAIRREIATLKRLKHPHIVKYITAEQKGEKIYTVMERLGGGSLADVLRTFGPQTPSATARYIAQMLSGLAYLHSQGIAHRDVKPDNVLVADEDGSVKLVDFGLAKPIVTQQPSGGASTLAGTPAYLAPEVFVPDLAAAAPPGPPYSADVWAVGISTAALLTGRTPFGRDGDAGPAVLVAIGDPRVTPHLPDSLPPDARSFILTCLARNAFDRPTAQQLLSHPFVAASVPVYPIESPAMVMPLAVATDAAVDSAGAAGSHAADLDDTDAVAQLSPAALAGAHAE